MSARASRASTWCRGSISTSSSNDDLYFSSKGHDAPGLYSVLIALGKLPFDKLHGLRRLGGLPGHPDVGVPGMVINSGSLGMGISKAKGMVRADRLKGHKRHYYVLTGDGELQEGQIWESLISAANAGMGEITAIVDHNKLQSDYRVSQTSDLGDLEAKFRSFGWHVERCDGHDLDEFSARARSLRRASWAPASDHRRHGQGTRRLLHGAHGDGFGHRHVSLPLRRSG